MKVGDVVGARRWPYEAAHPEGWGQPLRGKILSCNDRKAWEGSMLFATPSQQEVDAHVRWCREHGLLEDVVPVAWDFSPVGGDKARVLWSRKKDLRPYAEDCALWHEERSRALAGLARMGLDLRRAA